MRGLAGSKVRRIVLLAIPYCVAAAALGCSSVGHRGAGTSTAAERYRSEYAASAVPLLCELVEFETVAGNRAAHERQRAFVAATARSLGLDFRDAGPVAEIELAGPPGSPVLGLVVHGDVQPAEPAEWRLPPFHATVTDGKVHGRGAADDKAALVQALLAMAALRDSAVGRTHTVRLLVGSDEESGSTDMVEYLHTHAPPSVSLVLDAGFPVTIGEKAWNAMRVVAADPWRVRARGAPFRLERLDAGLEPSTVPSRATAVLAREPSFSAEALAALRAFPAPEGYRLDVEDDGRLVTVVAHGRAAHSGMAIERGRNALVFLAHALAGRIAPSGASDLLAFAAEAGADLHGRALGLDDSDPVWRPNVNVATVRPGPAGDLVLTVNVRVGPGLVKEALARHLHDRVVAFAERTGADVVPGAGTFRSEPLVIDPDAKLVRRLRAAYERVTGAAAPLAVSGGATYAKRIPNAIAFGMWFPGKPYPGHDVDEAQPIADLHRGAEVLIEALVDLATSPPIARPLEP